MNDSQEETILVVDMSKKGTEFKKDFRFQEILPFGYVKDMRVHLNPPGRLYSKHKIRSI